MNITIYTVSVNVKYVTIITVSATINAKLCVLTNQNIETVHNVMKKCLEGRLSPWLY